MGLVLELWDNFEFFADVPNTVTVTDTVTDTVTVAETVTDTVTVSVTVTVLTLLLLGQGCQTEFFYRCQIGFFLKLL